MTRGAWLKGHSVLKKLGKSLLIGVKESPLLTKKKISKSRLKTENNNAWGGGGRDIKLIIYCISVHKRNMHTLKNLLRFHGTISNSLRHLEHLHVFHTSFERIRDQIKNKFKNTMTVHKHSFRVRTLLINVRWTSLIRITSC